MKNRISMALKDPILQQSFECICKENEELREINKGYCRSRDRLVSMGFPNFKDCKEYADQLTKAKELLNEFMRISKASDEDFEHDYSELIEEVEQFINSEVENE